MKTNKNILIAFLLNLSFSIFEVFGGLLTGSVAIISDSIHDFGDSISLLCALVLENKSRKAKNDKYTYGYRRLSVLGAIITTLILIIGSTVAICTSINRLFNPTHINYNGMLIFAIVGVFFNLLAAYFTREKGSLNEKAVNLHMVEDVLGWIVVLVGSVLMKFTNLSIIDPILSICVSLYILIMAIKHFVESLGIFLEKSPVNVDAERFKIALYFIPMIKDVHHLHIWTLDGNTNYATIHVISNYENTRVLKEKIRKIANDYNIQHITIEIEREDEKCSEPECKPIKTKSVGCACHSSHNSRMYTRHR